MNLKIYEKTKYNNIYKHRKNGTYAVDLSLGYSSSGKRIRTTKTGFLTEKEARQSLANEESKRKSKNLIVNKTKFEDYLIEYYDWCKNTGQTKDEVLRRKKSRFDFHIIPYFKGIKFENIEEQHILNWHQYIEAKNLAPNTKATIHKQLSAYFNWLIIHKRIINFNPCLTVPNFKLPRQNITYRTLEEMQKLWDTIKTDSCISEEIKLRILAFTKILFCGGFRPGEVYGLQIRDFNFDILNSDDIPVNEVAIKIERTLYNGKGGWILGNGKTDGSLGTVYIGKQSFRPLFEYIKYMQQFVNFQATTYVFINPVSRKEINVFSQEAMRKYINYFVKTAGLPHTKPKDMRSSHGTFLLSNGCSLEEVQSRLRHAKKQTTEKYYATFYEETKINLAKKIDSFLK